MSSPATVSEYGKFIDLQSYNASAPAKSGSIYLSGAAGSELVRTNVGLSAAGNVTAVGSFIIGSADMSEADLEKLDGITNGTVAASKAVVVDANKDASGFRHVTATGNVTAGGSFIIGSADMDETDLEKLDGITNGTVAANKAVVVDGSKDADGFRNVTMTGDMTAGTITMTGFTVDADGDTALKSLLVDDSSTIGCDSDTDLMSLAAGALTVNGTLSADTSFTLDTTTLDATELGYLDSVTAGTAAASKALVLDASKNIGSINQLTASHIKVDQLDVNTINSLTTTVSDLEVTDKRIISALSASSANADGGGLQIGAGSNAGEGGFSAAHASILYDHANTALDFNIGGTTEMRLQDGVLRPETDNDVDLGASGAEFKDLYLDGVAYIDDLRADQLGAALDANSQAITNINVDSGAIDGTVIGANSAAAGTFAALVGTSLSVSDGDITNVGDIALDTISADGNDFDLVLTDNRSAAMQIRESSNVYMQFDTSNGSEAIFFKKELEVEQGAVVYDNKEIQFGTDETDSGASGSLKYVSASDVFQISGSAANGLKLVGDVDASGFNLQAAAGVLTSLSVSDGNITNVGDIALDSISADGNDIDLVMTDNRSAALEIKEGSNVYLQFETTNGSETIFAKKEFEFQAGANMDDNQTFKFGTDETDSGASGSLGYISASDVFQISGSAANGLKLVGDVDASGYALAAAAATVTSLSVSDGNITNVGSLACDSITVDDATVGLDVRFAGNTGLNKLTLTDNLASALDINEGGTSYLKFVTTNGQEEITAGKELVLSQGGLVADDQALVFGDDDDGSISFVSAANVVRFDGGSAGLHFNDTSVFGADGSGKDVSFHGAAANELMKYTAADHTLKFTDSSGAAHVTIGGDATSEFAVDVADGSNNKNKVRAAAFVTYSDERLKTDVSAIQNGLETVNNLKAVNFTWKKDGSRDFGFMAQELKQVIPQAVHGSEEGLYGVDYGRLSAILVSAIQEQSAQIASLKKQLENK